MVLGFQCIQMRNLEYGEYGEYGGGLRAIILLSLWIYFESRARPRMESNLEYGEYILSILACDLHPNGIQMSPKWVPNESRPGIESEISEIYSLSEFILNPGLAPESKEGVRSPSKIPNGIQMSPKWVPSRYRDPNE